MKLVCYSLVSLIDLGFKMFENLANDIELSIRKQIQDTKLVNIPYSGMITVPQDFIQDVWDSMDKESIKQKLADRLESELVDRIVNHMAAEISTDIKQVLSVKERREAIRSVCRDNIDSICKK